MTAVLIDVLKMWLCENVKNTLNVLYMYYILDKFMPRVSDIFWSRSHFIQFPTFWTESRIYSRPKFTFTFMHLADAFIQSDLQLHSGYAFFVSICVPWESNPQPFALLTQCSTTEPHRNTGNTNNNNNIFSVIWLRTTTNIRGSV